MKFRMTFDLLAMVVVAVIPSHAAGDSMPNAVEDQSGRRGGYAQSLPRLSRLREAIEADMQQTDVAGERTEISALEPVTVESGFVIYKGRYIPPPYTLRSERGTIYINELKLPQRRPGQFFRRFANVRPPNRGLHNRDAIHIEHHLREDGLLICSRNDPIAFVSAYQAASGLVNPAHGPSMTPIRLGKPSGQAGVRSPSFDKMRCRCKKTFMPDPQSQAPGSFTPSFHLVSHYLTPTMSLT